jgi:beta-glucuronidase
VDGRPWTVQGLTYKPTAVGDTPDEGPLPDWMTADRNANGTLDVLESFVDANRNHRQDADEPTVGDFALIRDMGVNTLRLYHTDHKPAVAKTILRRLHADHGFMVMMGDFVGMYTIGSGAKWEAGTDYLDKAQRQRMFEGVKAMVKEYKDEPYLLMWVLGNENNYGGVHGIVGGVGNAGRHPHEYYRFLNELATWIHAEDPHHPVAIGNGDALFLDIIATEAPAIDIFGANAYRGWQGVGRSFFEDVRQWLDKPTLITEYGCPAYQRDVSRDRAELDQAMYHFGNWVDIADNLAGRGAGNALGGIIFEWSDEWWKAGQPPRFSPTVQETVPNWAGPYPGGFMFEEWLGLVTQGDGSASPFLRQLRRSYELYQQLWSQERSP